MNGILKREWLNDMVLKINQARMQVERIIGIYNTRRPHMAIGLKVPDQAHRDKKRVIRQGHVLTPSVIGIGMPIKVKLLQELQFFEVNL
ncbi:MAG: integrase core domain-containing protein [Butyricimonas faecihominis]